MNTKLTLSLDKEVIEQAKQEAAARGISLSKMIEQLLAMTITPGPKKPKVKISPEVRKLRGMIKLPPDFDHKKARAEYLSKKYGL